MIEVNHVLLDPTLHIVIDECILYLLLHHAPALLAELTHGSKDRNARLGKVREVLLHGVDLLFS